VTDPDEPETPTADPDASADGSDTPADDAEPSATDATEPPAVDAGAVSLDAFHDALEDATRPVVTASEVARTLGCSQAAATEALSDLASAGDVERLDVETDPVVWFPSDWAAVAERERVTLFPERREVVVDRPTQFTRAQLSQFAHLADTNGDDGYVYEIRREDVWQAPYDTLDDLLGTVRQVLPDPAPGLAEWIEDQWKRAHQFVLRTHEDGYTVLEAASDDLMGNVARQRLDDGQLRAPIEDDTSWVAAERVAEVKRILYEAGYPVQDERDLDEGDDLDLELNVDLRGYQREWVREFTDVKSGVLVGPPGSGKTVAALGVLAAVGGETLILVPSRELATQWREELLARTTLTAAQVGEYHGGKKEVRPVTIATYQTAGMDRHRQLFDERRWGLIVYDEVHHVPATVYRRSADLQTKHRLGLSATPIREDDREKDIFTLIGPPIGTDWDALFDAGFVQEPEVEIRYVPWASDERQQEHASTSGHDRRQVAATNPAKLREVRHLLATHRDAKALIFVEYLDHGEALAEALSVPFLSGETRHARREKLLSEFRHGRRDTLVVSRVGDEGIDLPDADLVVVASGLGGSRRQGAQRAGRAMRPAGNALVYVLATRGTTEEEHAQRQLQHLSAKGIRVRERDAETLDASSS